MLSGCEGGEIADLVGRVQNNPDANTSVDGGSDAGNIPPTDGGTLVDDCTGRLVCDDFEKYAVGTKPTSPWGTSVSTGVVEVVNNKSYAGTQALHLKTNQAGSGYTAMLTLGSPILPTSNNAIYGRMMFWMDATAKNSCHTNILEASGQAIGKNYNVQYRYGTQWYKNNDDTMPPQRFMANYFANDNTSDCWAHSLTQMPLHKWICIRWKFDGAANKTGFWVDANELTDIAIDGNNFPGSANEAGCPAGDSDKKWYPANFNALKIGWQNVQNDDAGREIWIDNIIVDNKPIPCPN